MVEVVEVVSLVVLAGLQAGKPGLRLGSSAWASAAGCGFIAGLRKGSLEGCKATGCEPLDSPKRFVYELNVV